MQLNRKGGPLHLHTKLRNQIKTCFQNSAIIEDTYCLVSPSPPIINVGTRPKVSPKAVGTMHRKKKTITDIELAIK